MSGFSYKIDREKGFIQASYKSDNPNEFKNLDIRDCFQLFTEIITNLVDIIYFTKQINKEINDTNERKPK